MHTNSPTVYEGGNDNQYFYEPNGPYSGYE